MRKRVMDAGCPAHLAPKVVAWALLHGTRLTREEVAGLSGWKSGVAVGQAVRRLEQHRKADRVLDGILSTVHALLRGASAGTVLDAQTRPPPADAQIRYRNSTTRSFLSAVAIR